MRYLPFVVFSSASLLHLQPCVFLDALGQFPIEFGSVNFGKCL